MTDTALAPLPPFMLATLAPPRVVELTQGSRFVVYDNALHESVCAFTVVAVPYMAHVNGKLLASVAIDMELDEDPGSIYTMRLADLGFSDYELMAFEPGAQKVGTVWPRRFKLIDATWHDAQNKPPHVPWLDLSVNIEPKQPNGAS